MLAFCQSMFERGERSCATWEQTTAGRQNSFVVVFLPVFAASDYTKQQQSNRPTKEGTLVTEDHNDGRKAWSAPLRDFNRRAPFPPDREDYFTIRTLLDAHDQRCRIFVSRK